MRTVKVEYTCKSRIGLGHLFKVTFLVNGKAIHSTPIHGQGLGDLIEDWIVNDQLPAYIQKIRERKGL